MQFQLSGHQIEVTEAIRAHATSRLDRLTRLDDRIISLNLVISVNKLQQFAEGTLNVCGATLHAESAGPDMYASIDTVYEKLVNQLRRHREKVTDKHQREGREERLAV
jgi:putative sigma-54 modulation protein